MAPDLNSVPSSPYPSSSSTSTAATTTTISTSTTSASTSTAPTSTTATASNPSRSINSQRASQEMIRSSSEDNTGVGNGPGPLRHPRPMTAAELHMVLEKEQEAVMNRLTRELSLLRAAQNASVVSNASSTSTSTSLSTSNPTNTNTTTTNSYHDPTTHPTLSTQRNRRSSSSASARNNNNNNPNVLTSGFRSVRHDSNTSQTQTYTLGQGQGQNVTTTATANLNTYPQAISLSRQNSLTSSRRSRASSPGQHGGGGEYFPSASMQRQISRTRGEAATAVAAAGRTATIAGGREEATTTIPLNASGSGRYEEVAWQRRELENVLRENEELKRRVRELEALVREGVRERDGEGEKRSVVGGS